MRPGNRAVLLRVSSLAKTLRGHYPDEILEALDRLVTFEDMKPIWDALATSEDEALPEHFLDACAVSLGQWARLSKMPLRELERTLHKVALQAEELGRELRKFHAEINLQGTPLTVYVRALPQGAHALTIPLLDATTNEHSNVASLALQAHGVTPVDAPALGVFASDAAETERKVQESAEDVVSREAELLDESYPWGDCVLVDELLMELAARLRRPPASELVEIRPTKVNASSAQQTFLARSLTYFLVSHGCGRRPEWVAAATSALLDLDPPLEPDLVSKNTRDLRMERRDTADDFRPPKID